MTASIRNMKIDQISRGKRGMSYKQPAAVCGILSIMKTDGRYRLAFDQRKHRPLAVSTA